jgi:hypothetical protein
MSPIALLVLATTMAVAPPAGDAATVDRPVAVFADLDGTWRGTFVGYDTTGKELYRIAVTQHYETVNATTQRVKIEDVMSDGTRITGEGENVARRGDDGALALTCVVRKSNGETARHRGRIVTGPDGGKGLVWYSSAPDRVETFRETVRREGAEHVYEINGLGQYGRTLILMHGRYVKQPEPPAAAD